MQHIVLHEYFYLLIEMWCG